MPYLERPDGIEIYWEERGSGPLVVLANQFFGYPEVYQGLIDDISRDHRVVTYDLRGTGRSTRSGPYSMVTDAADLTALLEELGGGALVYGMGDGCNRAVKVAAEHPDLVRAIVTSGGNPVGQVAARGTESLAASPSVLQALLSMMDTDYRAALNTMIANANPDTSEEEVRERVNRIVAHCPHEAAAPRLHDWIHDETSLEDSRAVGDRLVMLEFGGTPWFNEELLPITRKLLPEARIEEVEAGVISRPDIAAEVVRRITAAEPLARVSGGVGEPR